jgi:hypothetical protein
MAKDRFEELAFRFAVIDRFMKALDRREDLFDSIVKFC